MSNKLYIKSGKSIPKKDEPIKVARHEVGPSNAGIAQTVLEQLEEDYGNRYLGWILGAHWTGPEFINLSEIDVTNRRNWMASEDMEHVDDFLEQVKEGNIKPIILVNEPNNNKMIIADGHHRFLAAEKLNMPVKAYVATTGGVGGDWRKMHDKQNSGEYEGQEMSQQKSNQK